MLTEKRPSWGRRRSDMSASAINLRRDTMAVVMFLVIHDLFMQNAVRYGGEYAERLRPAQYEYPMHWP